MLKSIPKTMKSTKVYLFVHCNVYGLFPSCSSRSSSMMQSHEDVITKANRLLTGLRTSPAAMVGQHSRSMKKRCRPSLVEKEYNKNLVSIEFPGHSPPEVQVLYDYYKLYEGSLSFTMSMTEAEIRKKIASPIREKSF